MTRLKNRIQRVLHCLCALGLICTWTSSSAAEKNSAPELGVSLQIACAPDQPLVHAGESVTLRAWVTDASGNPLEQTVRFTWSAAAGEIAGGDVATWSFGPATEGSGGVTKATAKVIAEHEKLGQVTCELVVYATKDVSPSTSASARRSNRLSARALLLSENAPPRGYGLYSYLLFDTPPNGEQERERYLKAIEAYFLVLQPIEEMGRHRRRSELNIVMLPVKRSFDLPDNLSEPNQAAQAALQVLAAYDYARAQVLLSELGGNVVRSGPYLVSKLPAGSTEKGTPLFFDMSHVVPRLVWNWVRAFCSLAAQERSWSDVSLRKLALNTRNVVAVAARETPEVITRLNDWIPLLGH